MDQETGGAGEKKRLRRLRLFGRRWLPVWLLGLALLIAGPLRGLEAGPGADAGIPDLDRPIGVKQVIDGDTIELINNERVRYLGIDAPEMRRKVNGRWIKIMESFAAEAYELNRGLVEGRSVRIELDREIRDRYDRLLGYVFVDGLLVNAELISSGYVVVRIHAPNDRYADLFIKLQAEARAEGRGIWGSRDGDWRGGSPRDGSKE